MAKLVLVGCGVMGSAIAEAVIQKGLYGAGDMLIVEKFTNPHTEQLAKNGATILESVESLKAIQELIILAVKPQDAAKVLQGIKSKTDGSSLVISVMAGITLAVMEAELTQAQLIRCIPNTPCAILQGMAVYCGNQKVSGAALKTAQSILSLMGKAFAVDSEILIDAATAISGSGPAYLFYLAEALQEGAIHLGFTEQQADLLARQTLLGASTLLSQSKDTPRELRRKVTSPKGTTEAAVACFDQNKLKSILLKGFQAAFDRSLELGKPN
jgi:pyrroline-5-carboxylate reductase